MSRSPWPTGSSGHAPSFPRSRHAAGCRCSSAGPDCTSSALVDGHDYAGQPWSPELRQRLTEELETDGLEPLVARLRQRIRSRRQRSTCATRGACCGRSSARRPGGAERRERHAYAGKVALVGLDRPREVLYRRIDERARQLFEGGLLDEVRRLRAAGYGPELRPMTGHGYAEAAAYLAGEWTLDEAVAVTARRTRQYAKRQLTWFRRDPRVAWIPVGDGPGGRRRGRRSGRARAADGAQLIGSPSDWRQAATPLRASVGVVIGVITGSIACASGPGRPR